MATTVDGIAIRLGADPTGLQQGIRRAEAAIDTFGSRAKAVIGRMGTAIKGTADRALNPLTAALTGGGIAVAVNQINGVELAMTRLGNQAGWSADKIAQVTAQAYASAKRTGQPVEELVAGMARFVDATGDGETAIALLGDTATASSAVGAGFEDMGAIAAQLGQKFNIAKEDLGAWFEILSTQGDKGAFTLADLANNGERLFSAAASGGTTQAGLRSFGALIQVARGATGSAEQATTAIEATFRSFKQKAGDIRKLTGFDVFDGQGNLKDAETILKAIYDYTDGSTKKLTKFGFDSEAMRFIEEFQRKRKEGGDYGFLEDLKNAAPAAKDMNNIQEKFGRVMANNAMQLRAAKAGMQQLLAVHMAGPIDKFTKALQYLNEHQKLVEYGFMAIAAAAAALVAVKVASWGMEMAKFGKELFDIAKGKKGGTGGALGDVVDGIGVQKVYVVNMPGGGLPGMGGIPGGSEFPMPKAPTAAPKAAGWFTRLFPSFAKGLNIVKSNLLSLGGIIALWGAKIGLAFSAVGTAIGTALVATAPLWVTIAGLTVAAGALLFMLGQFINLQIERNAAEKRIVDMQKGNAATIYSKYGEEASGLLSQSQDIDREIAMEESTWFPDQEKIDNLLAHKSNLDSMYRDAVKQSIARRKDSVVGQDTPINNEFKIFVDPAKQTAVVEQVNGPVNGKFKASTKPWSGGFQ